MMMSLKLGNRVPTPQTKREESKTTPSGHEKKMAKQNREIEKRSPRNILAVVRKKKRLRPLQDESAAESKTLCSENSERKVTSKDSDRVNLYVDACAVPRILQRAQDAWGTSVGK
jgi:hypothetical protein